VTSGGLLGGATVLKLDDLFACTPSDEGVARPRGCLCNTPAFARLNARLSSKFCRAGLDAAAGVFAAGAGGSPAKAAASGRRTAFVNARVFDGKSDNLRTGLRVVIEGGTIRAVEAADALIGEGGAIVDCGGRVLMPGLIDAHWHAMMAAIPLDALLTADVGYINLVAAAEAESTLMRGFTSVRDMAGPAFALKRAIDEGVYQVKRIVVRPGGRLSLQKHYHRAEHWIVVRGAAEVTLNGAVQLVHENESIYLPIGSDHRLANPGRIDLELIEVQTGSYLGEDDIVRIEDVYNRT